MLDITSSFDYKFKGITLVEYDIKLTYRKTIILEIEVGLIINSKMTLALKWAFGLRPGHRYFWAVLTLED